MGFQSDSVISLFPFVLKRIKDQSCLLSTLLPENDYVVHQVQPPKSDIEGDFSKVRQ